MKFRLAIILVVLLSAGAFVAQASAAKGGSKNTPKPGWGKGDDKHEHVGPPGKSVIVDHDEDDSNEDDEDENESSDDDKDDDKGKNDDKNKNNGKNKVVTSPKKK
jgi:hypothetical protein